ncbi:50S ribosomal protein L29 [Patescibacteria group bacterium]|nr:50S ribosomal protein L29 [Patescibacteria group bacterium]
MDMKELRTKPAEELLRLLGETVRDEQELRRKLALRSYSKTADVLRSRRLIARIKTALALQKRATTV